MFCSLTFPQRLPIFVCLRIHVPIITGPEVRFQVGANEESMADFLFDEGVQRDMTL